MLRKNMYSFSFLVLVASCFVFAEKAYALSPPFPQFTVLELFLVFLFQGGMVFFIVPIMLGCTFHRRFLSVWNFLILLSIYLAAILIPHPFLIGGGKLTESLLLLGLLISSACTMVAFFVSSVARRIFTPRVQNAPIIIQVTMLFLTYVCVIFLWYSFLIFFDTLGSLFLISMLVTILSAALLIWLYRKTGVYSKKTLTYHWTDYIYFSILLGVFLVSLFSSQFVDYY